MSTLTGTKIKDGYKSLIKTEATTGFNSSTPTRIEDGDGVKSAIHLGKSSLHISGSAGINIAATSTPSANLHIIGTATKSMLVENSDGYDKFYIGDTNSAYNVKLGDIDGTSPGNNTYMAIEDNNNKVYTKSTYFGVNNTVPTATLHVGNFSGTANFSLGSDTSAFKVGKSGNTELLKVDTQNEKVVINGSLEMTGTGSFRKSTQRIDIEEYFTQLPRPYLFTSATKDWGSIDDGNEEAFDVTVTGAALGDFARASFSLDVTDLELSAQVTAANTVTVTLSNNTGGALDLGSGTVYVNVDEREHLHYKNPNIMITGTNADGVGTDVSWDVNNGGVILQTDGADNDQVILFPRGTSALDPISASMWGTNLWQTDSQVIWSGAIKTHSSIADIAIFAGLKETAVGTAATDDHQAYFLYDTDDSMVTLTTNANLHFVYSVSGTDYITDLGLAIAADTIYRLRIEIDSSRQVSVFVNDTQYGLVTTATAGGATQSVSTTKSNALTTDRGLLATIGIQALTGSVKSLYVFYEKISRIIGS